MTKDHSDPYAIDPTADTVPLDDLVLPFNTVQSGMVGRIVRLGSVADTILSRHAYPEGVSRGLGEALALCTALGTALKFDGKFILQTKSDGPLRFVVVNFESPGMVRGYASFEAAAFADTGVGEALDASLLLGAGHLAFTIDPGKGRERYQGIVPLEGGGLAEAALAYFRQSEQLPTFIRLSVARQFIAGESGAAGRWHWRAGALMVQHVPKEGGTPPPPTPEQEEAGLLYGEDDDDWNRVQLLAATVEDHELIDPLLAPEQLLLRLFHEEGVRVFPATGIKVHCTCSRDRIGVMLKNFGAQELSDMREADGSVAVTCEFCTTRFRFEPAEFS